MKVFSLSYLRSANDEKQLTENSIKAIVSIHSGPGIHNFSDKYAVLHLTLDDSTEENVTKHFTTVNSFVHEFRLRKGFLKFFLFYIKIVRIKCPQILLSFKPQSRFLGLFYPLME